MEYRLRHKDESYRWVKSNGICLRDEKGTPSHFVISHNDITEQKKAEQKLNEINDRLEERVIERTAMLEEMNSALKILLKKREEDKKEISENIYSNYKSLVMPYLQKLKSSLAMQEQKYLIDILESNLIEIVSPFSKSLTNPMVNLTPTEVQIAGLVKNGLTNKEMAEILNKSNRAIAAHRENIRKKLGLINKKINLRAFLSTPK
jgi:DNA-binding CsgD family transcriptional regulator